MRTNLKIILVLSSIIVSIILGLTGCSIGADDSAKPLPEMVGTWIGSGVHNLTSEFLDQKEIPAKIDVNPNGEISGFIGDAQMSRTHLQKRGWIERTFGRPAYWAEIKLGGYLVSRESYKKDGGTLNFKRVNKDEMICEFISTGNRVNINDMQMVIKNLELRRPAKP